MSFFHIGIPARPPITEFEVKENYFMATAQNPSQISSVYFSLMQPLDENLAAGLFYSAYPYQELTYLTVIANEMPSQIISTGFGLNEEISRFPEIKFVM